MLLLGLGAFVTWRFLTSAARDPRFHRRPSGPLPGAAGLAAGVLDAVGGGGWGPVGTTSLLSSGRLEPRKVVGSVDTAEFVVSVGGSLGFLAALGSQGIAWPVVGALLVGGVVAAPSRRWSSACSRRGSSASCRRPDRAHQPEDAG